MKDLQSFYNTFYGISFIRHFRRPNNLNKNRLKIQFIVENPKDLYVHVHKNNGFHPCYTHVYDHGTIDNLNGKNKDNIVYDRAFFDFDVDDHKVSKLKKELRSLRSQGLHHEEKRQLELKQKIQNIIINERAAEPAILQAKKFSQEFKETFGSELALFFSGCKGCHAYTFFKISKFINLDRALSWFAKEQKTKYSALDLAVTKDATNRLSRVPYTKHQDTSLTVVQFSLNDKYEDIIEKSLNPLIESFNISDYTSNFNIHLQKIDEILEKDDKFQKATKKEHNTLSYPKFKNRVKDHRIFFENLLGKPEREYPEKEYVMYKCPFHDHEDNKPSFRVHKTGYYCYGCERKGNYWQFLKDYYHWNDNEVKNFLKNRMKK